MGYFVKQKKITFVTHKSCPPSITSFVTLTSHVITSSSVFAMSSTTTIAIFTVPSYYTFYLNKTKIQINTQYAFYRLVIVSNS